MAKSKAIVERKLRVQIIRVLFFGVSWSILIGSFIKSFMS